MTDRYAVIGNPIAHSQSPRIHALFARALGEDIEYGTILGRPGHFDDDVDGFRRAGGRGMNVTVPFKLDAFAYATIRSERAAQAGAINTLKFDGDRVLGDNTDGAGLVRDIHALGFAVEGSRVLLMGAGGAARGVLLPLLGERPASIAIANRTEEKARALAVQFAPHAASTALTGGGYEAVTGQSFDLVINATSASLSDQVPPVPAEAFAPRSLAYDMVYGERAQTFLAFATAHGAARTADGLGMLVEQAAESFFLWRGVRPDTASVQAALRGGEQQDPGRQTRDNGATLAGTR
jgi:shikimate dehydrogenase